MPPLVEPVERACHDPLSAESWNPRSDLRESAQLWAVERAKPTRCAGPLGSSKAAGHAWERLPHELYHIRLAIEESRGLLELGPDEDTPDTRYSEATWRRAAEFLAKNAEWVWDSFGRRLDAPEILPGPKGSIDLDWDYPPYEMLINIPADPAAEAGFYGDDRGKVAIKGTFDPTVYNHGLLLWLARAK